MGRPFGHKLSAATKAKMSASQRKRTDKCKPTVIDGILFPSRSAAAKHFNVNVNAINTWIRDNDGRSRTRNGRPFTALGKTYKSYAEAGVALGIPPNELGVYVKVKALLTKMYRENRT